MSNFDLESFRAWLKGQYKYGLQTPEMCARNILINQTLKQLPHAPHPPGTVLRDGDGNLAEAQGSGVTWGLVPSDPLDDDEMRDYTVIYTPDGD